MIVFPNSKINLGLYIENKREDGYHNIRTLFYPIYLNDALEILSTGEDGIQLDITGIAVEGNLQSNLCVKAYHLLKREFDLPDVKIHLHKAIPLGAGLGGGSADAAYTIKLLNDLFNLNLSYEQMHQYASELGSDVAFFIRNTPVIASGKGDIFEDVDFNLNQYKIIVVKPPLHVSTPEAYQWIRPRNTEIDILSIINNPVDCWKDILHNDFENSVFEKYPAIAHIKQELYRNGAVYAAMSGSGAAVFGLFTEEIPDLCFPENYFIWRESL